MKTLLWIIIGIIVIALLASLAFGLGDEEEMQMATTTPTAQVATSTMTVEDLARVRAEAVTELASLRARVAAGESYEALADDYAAVRARVTAAYASAGVAASDEWQDIQAGFNSFEASARAGGSAALDSFASLIASLSADVGTETPAE
jgi:hypothetical protein